MRVLFLTHRLPYAPNRGDRIRAYYLLREMSRFARVTLFSFVHDDAELAEASKVPFADRVETVRVQPVLNAVRGVARLPTPTPLTHSLLDGGGLREALQRAISSNPPDVVLAFCSGMARLAMEPPLEDLPFVLDMVDVDSAKWLELARTATPPRSWIFNREARTLREFEARATMHAACTLVVNERERQTLQEIAPHARIVTLSNGIDVASFAPAGPPASDPHVIFCGVMDYAPNADAVRWFAEAIWPTVRAARPDARFRIVGARPTAAVLQLAKADRSIEVTGGVDAVQPHLWRSAVSVAPLRVARGLQNKVLEALAAGLPVVTTPAVAAGLPEAVRPGCCECDSAERFASALLELLKMAPEERRARADLASLRTLDWSTCLRPLEDLLASAAAAVGQ